MEQGEDTRACLQFTETFAYQLIKYDIYKAGNATNTVNRLSCNALDLFLRLQLVNGVHALSEFKVESGQAFLIVGVESHIHDIVKIGPIWVVLISFSQLSPLRHEQKGLLKIRKFERSLDGGAGGCIRKSPIGNRF